MIRTHAAAMAALLVLVVACGESPTAGTAEMQRRPTTGSTLSEVAEAVGDQASEERTARLAELAMAESGAFTLYTSMTIDDAEAVVEAFEGTFGLDVQVFRASSDKVLQRLLQESDAGYHGADVVLNGALEMNALTQEGLLEPLDTPASADILNAAVYPTWAGVYLQTFVAVWNTDTLDPADVPSTWEEVLAGYGDGLAMELGDFDWFATLVQDHFVAERGLSESAAVDLFRRAARSATIVDGHTLMAELLAAGEFEIAASAYEARVGRLIGAGAPIAWEPPVEPLVFRPNGVGIHTDTDRPATALLFAEFLLTTAQPLLADLGRTPASTTTPGGLDPDYEVLPVDVDALSDQRAKWEGLYAEIVELSGSTVVEE